MMPIVAHKIKQIEIHTKRLMKINLLGSARSRVKGSGLEFDQLRDYEIGDDVRAIDWNSSARNNKLLIKQFNDERQRTIIIALDISESCFFGSDSFLKEDILAHCAAIISYAAMMNKDEVGLVLFNEKVHVYIPPAKGKAHVQLILEKIFSAQAQKHATNIEIVLDHLASLRKKNALVFLISDFLSADFEQKLTIAARIYDIIAIRMIDEFEKQFPVSGLLRMYDSETQNMHILNMRNKKKNDVNSYLQNRLEEQNNVFKKHRIDLLDVTYQQEPIDQLISFFKTRALR